MRSSSGGRLRRLGILVLAGAALLAPWPALPDDAKDTKDQKDQADASSGEPTPEEAAPEALGADSGVAVQTMCTNCNNADLSLGALGNDHVVVTCDGQPVPPGLAQIYLLSIVPATMIDRITVNKGACKVEYEGGAVGGGLEIERRPIEPGLAVNASADMGAFGWRGNKIDLSGKNGKVGSYFVGTSARSDKIDPNGDGQANLPEFDRTTLEGGVQFEPGRNHRLRFGAANYRESQRDGPAGSYLGSSTYNRENVELDRKQYDAVYEWSGRGGSTLSIAGSWAERGLDIDETDSPDSVCLNQFVVFPNFLFERHCPAYVIDDTRGHAGISWSRPIGTQAKIAAGGSRTRGDYNIVDVKYNVIKASSVPNFPLHFSLQETVTEYGVWIEGQTALGAQVDLTAGVRYAQFAYEDNEAEVSALDQNHDWLGFPLPEGDKLLPRGALTWKPTEEVNLRFTAGTGFRAPLPAFSEVCCGRKYRNNRGLAPESSVSYGVEATFQPGPYARVGASAFLTDFDNLMVNMITASNNQNTYQYVNVPEARKTSLTIDARIDGPAWLTTRISYSLLDAENRTPNDDIPALVEVTTDDLSTVHYRYGRIPASVDRRGAVGLDFRLPRSFGLAISAQYTGPTHVQFIDQDAPALPEVGKLDRSSLVEKEDFWVVNLGLRKPFKSGLELFAGVDNVFDFFQTDLDDSHFDTNWGPLRGRYVYGGLGYHFENDKKK